MQARTKNLSEKHPDARHASPSKREFIFVKANADELAQSAEPNKNKANALLDVNEHCEGEHNNADGTFRIGSKLNLQEILEPIKPELERLEQRLLNEISPDSRSLSTIVQDIFQAGGKRLRPAISFLVYKALSSHREPEGRGDLHALSAEIASASPRHDEVASPRNDISEKLYLIAEISELIHTASLIHDDIIDNSLVRRSMPTLNSKWNNAITVVSGDFMFARAAVNLGKLDINEIVCLYARVLENLCAGEIEQIEHKYDTELNWDYYYTKTYKKTASLIEASAESIAVLLAVEPATREAIKTYGYQLGMAFQLIDDILDYTASAEALGKPAGSDLRDGQVTLPVLITLESLSASEREDFNKLVKQLADNEPVLDQLLTYIEKSNAINKSSTIASEHITKAKDALKPIPDSIYKTALLDLADFIVSRSH